MTPGLETEEQRERHIASLVRALHGAEARGDKEATKACQEALAGTTYGAQAPAKRAEKRPAQKKKETR